MDLSLKIGIIGEFDPNRPSHRATDNALQHAASDLSVDLAIDWLPTPILADDADKRTLRRFDALWCAPGGQYESINGALQSIRFAREQDWPFFAT
jgi:CTP synthase (UTP-ammonia lyase)